MLELSEHTQKRIASTFKPGLAPELLASVRSQTMAGVRQRQRGGAGDASPAALDINSISARLRPDNPSSCRNPWYVRVRCSHGHEGVLSVRCRKCEGCQNAWRNKVRHLVQDGAQGHTTFMWTLTLKEYPQDMDKGRFDYAQERWHRFLRECDRRAIRLDYLRVVELQQRGTPHYHAAIKEVSHSGQAIRSTALVRELLGHLARKCGFGVQMVMQRARLGARGVASYMAKYLGKGGAEGLYRDDGRSIRRYCRSRGWCVVSKPARVWRYAKIGGVFRNGTETPVQCECAQGYRLDQLAQIRRWIVACHSEGRWVAPLDMYDYLQNDYKGGY
jgi:hypothetical protein